MSDAKERYSDGDTEAYWYKQVDKYDDEHQL